MQGELFQRLTWASIIGGALFTLGGVLPLARFLVSRWGSLKPATTEQVQPAVPYGVEPSGHLPSRP